MGIVSPTNQELLINSICFGIPALSFFILRVINSAVVMGRFKQDDWVMSVTMFFYLSLLILINISGRFATNLYLPEQAADIFADPEQVRSRIIGSKIVIALEQCMLALTWGVKICILIFINRIVYKVPRLQLAVRFLAAYVVLSYIGIQLAYYVGICRPFKQYYAMPVHNQECATYATYSKVQMVFNISSDVLLIALPIHMIWALQMRISQKLTLSMVFSLALFTILAAILNKVYNFQSPFTTTYQLWYIRESSVAVMVSNMICTWQLLQKVFKLRTWDGSSRRIQEHAVMRERPTSRSSRFASFFSFSSSFSRPGTESQKSQSTATATLVGRHADGDGDEDYNPLRLHPINGEEA